MWVRDSPQGERDDHLANFKERRTYENGIGAREDDNTKFKRLFKNVVRGFSLVLHDPKGSHYTSPLSRGQDLEVKSLRYSQDKSKPKARVKLNSLFKERRKGK
jgi:hypothetical protein